MRRRGLDGFGEWNSLDPHVPRSQQFVRPVLDPAGHVGIGGAAVGRVVLEASILGRIVRRRDDDAVGEMILVFATAVVNENGARDYGGRRYAVVFLDDRLYVVGG